jgi:hypothetical protein
MTAVTLFADARRRQRVMKKSSIRFSLTGGHVDCIVVESVARLSTGHRELDESRDHRTTGSQSASDDRVAKDVHQIVSPQLDELLKFVRSSAVLNIAELAH